MFVDEVLPVCVFLLVVMVRYSHGVVVTDQSVVIDRVNQLRSRAGASDMAEMIWNSDLANRANNVSVACTTDFSKLPRGMGLSLYITSGPTAVDSNMAIDFWTRQSGAYSTEGYQCYATNCGGYSQLVWSSSEQMGCAYHKCEALAGTSYKNVFVYACVFSPGGNIDGTYAYNNSGPACSKCRSGAGWCTTSGLCKTNCVAESSSCKCQQSCVNQGAVDQSTCKCVCPDGFYGTDCSTKCVDDSLCDPQPGVPGYLPRMCNIAGVQTKCPRMCKLCKLAE